MANNTAPPTKLAAWQALEAHYPKIRDLHLRKLFAGDPKCGERMTAAEPYLHHHPDSAPWEIQGASV